MSIGDRIQFNVVSPTNADHASWTQGVWDAEVVDLRRKLIQAEHDRDVARDRAASLKHHGKTVTELWICAEWYAEHIMAQVDDMATRAEIRRMADAAVGEAVADVVNTRLAWLEEYLPKIQAENEKLRHENARLRGFRGQLQEMERGCA